MLTATLVCLIGQSVHSCLLGQNFFARIQPILPLLASYTNSTTGLLIQEPNGLEIEHYKEACVMLCDQTVQWNTFCRAKLNDASCSMQLPFACRMELADYDYY
uniref:Uncharacterized protein n=1 Tax=Ditylenchus dipsaci TaxID=166011 RepID=A0A915EU23_9BILA